MVISGWAGRRRPQRSSLALLGWTLVSLCLSPSFVLRFFVGRISAKQFLCGPCVRTARPGLATQPTPPEYAPFVPVAGFNHRSLRPRMPTAVLRLASLVALRLSGHQSVAITRCCFADPSCSLGFPRSSSATLPLGVLARPSLLPHLASASLTLSLGAPSGRTPIGVLPHSLSLLFSPLGFPCYSLTPWGHPAPRERHCQWGHPLGNRGPCRPLGTVDKAVG